MRVAAVFAFLASLPLATTGHSLAALLCGQRDAPRCAAAIASGDSPATIARSLAPVVSARVLDALVDPAPATALLGAAHPALDAHIAAIARPLRRMPRPTVRDAAAIITQALTAQSEALHESFGGKTGQENRPATSIAQALHSGKTSQEKESTPKKMGQSEDLPEHSAAAEYPYFGFLPKFLAAVTDAAPVAPVATQCYSNVTLRLTQQTQEGRLVVTATPEGQPTSAVCTDVLLAATNAADGFTVASLSGLSDAPTTLTLDARHLSQDQRWWVANNGVRVFRFRAGLLGLIHSVLQTVVLVAGVAESPLPNATLDANLAFMRRYVEVSPRMQPLSTRRAAGAAAGLDPAVERSIESGDSIAIVRYDGLNPFEGWAEGWTGGHTTIALRDPTNNNALLICESTVGGAFWPRNGVQCTPYREWMARAIRAEMNVVIAPLAKQYRAAFNATAALAFFRAHEGLNYGFLNYLFGYLDTPRRNFPCLPPDYKFCLGAEAFELLAFAVDSLQHNATTNFLRQAINHRLAPDRAVLNASALVSVSQALFRYAAAANATTTSGATTTATTTTAAELWGRLITVPERDTWMYHTTRYGRPAVGRAMVCCTFVCAMLKAAGVFASINDDIQCGEQTLWDVFSMQIWDASRMGPNRPAACVAADPSNELCQLGGAFTMFVRPDLDARPLYPHMGEHCSSQGPEYRREPGC